MNEERDMEALAGEFIPDEEEMKRQIEEEWERMYERGETIREGDASAGAYYRWLSRYGLDFFGALRRKGWIEEDEED